MELDYQAIGRRVRAARVGGGLTQETLAERAGISVTHMSNIETGSSKLSLPVLVALANALDVPADALLCDNLRHSREIFWQQIQDLTADCSVQELRILEDLLRGAKQTLRRHWNDTP